MSSISESTVGFFVDNTPIIGAAISMKDTYKKYNVNSKKINKRKNALQHMKKDLEHKIAKGDGKQKDAGQLKDLRNRTKKGIHKARGQLQRQKTEALITGGATLLKEAATNIISIPYAGPVITGAATFVRELSLSDESKKREPKAVSIAKKSGYESVKDYSSSIFYDGIIEGTKRIVSSCEIL